MTGRLCQQTAPKVSRLQTEPEEEPGLSESLRWCKGDNMKTTKHIHIHYF